VRINLGEADMDSVIRKTVLRNSSQGADQVRAMLDSRAGEISRHLRGSRFAHRAEDTNDAVLDWPLLPSRRGVSIQSPAPDPLRLRGRVRRCARPD
jgi:hypothetical protein